MCWFKRSPTLQLHDQGPDVLEASKSLQKHGSKLKETDIFTLAMRSAVISFQKKHDIEPTGVIDKQTWKALRKKHRKC